ncbi:VOC family protein [bacterium]|nr:MAG: VOC family protein [bacterium]
MVAKPDVRVSLAPLLSVRRSAEAVEFYKSAIGAVEVYRMEEDPEAGVISRLSVEGAEFWVSEGSPENASYSPSTLNGATTRMILTVPNPDALVAQAIAAGAKEVWPVGEGYGWRLGRITDPYGHDWEIGHVLAETHE